MAEKKKVQKKIGFFKLLWRIVKWIGLAALSLLIIAALFFQAPWKVTTLLIIFLLACTALPKPYRKWFWASVGAVIIALIIWVFLPDTSDGWRPYTFDEELTALQAKYAVPDKENAALIYNQLLASYDANTPEPNVPDPNTYYSLTVTEPWLNKDHPEMAEWLQQQESTVKTLMKASRLSKCRFPINADLLELQSMKQLGAMRYWAKLLIRAGNNDLGEGRIEQAIQKNLAVLQMGKHLSQQPALIDVLSGVAIEGLAIARIKEFIVTSDASEEHLIIIEKALTDIEHNWSSDFPRFLETETLTMKNLIGIFYETNSKGHVRFNRSLLETMMTKSKIDVEEIKEGKINLYWHKKLFKASVFLYWFYIPPTPQKAAKIIDSSYEKYYAIAKPNYDWKSEPAKPPKWPKLNFRFMIKSLANIMEGTYPKIHYLYLRSNAQQKGAQIIIALRKYKNQHGQWPGSLEDVKDLAPANAFIDPINGGSFVYKLTEDNFMLYSKGKNNIDENGESNTEWNEETFESKVLEDDILIWPPKSSKKSKEEQADDK